MKDELNDNLASDLIGKTITGVRQGPDGFDLIFSDGSEVEIYFIHHELCWAVLTAAEAVAAAQRP